MAQHKVGKPRKIPGLDKKLIPLDIEQQAATKDAKASDRLVCIFQMVHEHCCEKPLEADVRFAAALATKEQPYMRRQPVGPAWVALDLGWLVGAVGHILIVNPGKGPRDKKEAANPENCVLLGMPGIPGSMEWSIQPGQFHFGRPVDTEGFMLRALGDPVEVTVYGIPR